MIIPKPQKHHLLFVGDDGFYGTILPNHLGVSLHHVLYDKSTGLANNKPIDEVVINYIDKQKPHAIVTCVQPFVAKVCKSLWVKHAVENRIPVGLIWHDGMNHRDWVESMSFNCLNIILDDQKYQGKNNENNLPIWTPTSVESREPCEERPIDVCFLGSVDCQQRIEALKYLLNKGIPVFTSGHSDWCKLDYGIMYYYLRQSKIVLNFAHNRFLKPTTSSLKGRVLEAMISGAMVIENENENTDRWFKPGEDFVWYKNLPDLYDKISYYLKNERDRIKIAYNGQFRCLKDYDNINWWKTVLKKLLNFKFKVKM